MITPTFPIIHMILDMRLPVHREPGSRMDSKLEQKEAVRDLPYKFLHNQTGHGSASGRGWEGGSKVRELDE
jgi:hypothetical protein